MTRLWKIQSNKLTSVPSLVPSAESRIENWIADDPSILGLKLLIIARQQRTDYGGRIDLLGIDDSGDLTVIELKRDKTPRETIAQALDYASWVAQLRTPRVIEIANAFLHRQLRDAFKEKFGNELPDVLNSAHNILIVASGFDPSSRRIVEYLADEHELSINTAFFTYFEDSGSQYLASEFLLDQNEVTEKADSRRKAPWSGYFYLNVGNDENRDWDDMRKYGFVSAGGGRQYSGKLDQLSVGDLFFAYQKGRGYVGFGKVRSKAVPAKDFLLADGRPLNGETLKQPNIFREPENPELAEYVVGVEWRRTYSLEEAKWLEGGFANQNIVCKLRDAQTVEYLHRAFGVD